MATAAKHPPSTSSDHTSAEHALVYVHSEIPGISSNDLVKLVASIGAETHGKYTMQTIINATNAYKNGNGINAPTNWRTYIGKVIQAGSRHGQKTWVAGFTDTLNDPSQGNGPTTIESGAIHVQNGINGATKTVSNVASGVGNLAGGIGDLFTSPVIILLVVALVVILVAKK